MRPGMATAEESPQSQSSGRDNWAGSPDVGEWGSVSDLPEQSSFNTAVGVHPVARTRVHAGNHTYFERIGCVACLRTAVSLSCLAGNAAFWILILAVGYVAHNLFNYAGKIPGSHLDVCLLLWQTGYNAQLLHTTPCKFVTNAQGPSGRGSRRPLERMPVVASRQYQLLGPQCQLNLPGN